MMSDVEVLDVREVGTHWQGRWGSIGSGPGRLREEDQGNVSVLISNSRSSGRP